MDEGLERDDDTAHECRTRGAREANRPGISAVGEHEPAQNRERQHRYRERRVIRKVFGETAHAPDEEKEQREDGRNQESRGMHHRVGQHRAKRCGWIRDRVITRNDLTEHVRDPHHHDGGEREDKHFEVGVMVVGRHDDAAHDNRAVDRRRSNQKPQAALRNG